MLCTVATIFNSLVAAQVKKVNEFSIGKSQSSWTLNDPYGYFHRDIITTTPEGDIFMFSSSPTGTWELTRIRNWMTSTPEIKHLPLPGYFSIKQRNDLDDITMQLYTFSNSQYVICAASAEWLKREHGKAVGNARNKLLMAVVDKDSMAIRTNKSIPDGISADFVSIELSNTNELIFSTSHWNPFTNSVGSQNHQQKYTRLSVPELLETDSCNVEWKPSKPGAGDEPFPIMDESCMRLLRGRTYHEMMTTKSDQQAHGYSCTDKKLEFCPQPEKFTPDGKIGLGFCTTGHDTLLGSWVEDSATAVLFSTATKREFAAYDIKHDDLYVQLTTSNGKDYLIGFLKRNIFRIYEIDVH